MGVIKCPTGWLVVPSETGDEYVPFFIQVRDEDIHWKSNDKLLTYINKNINEPNDSISQLNPGQTYKINRNDWLIELQSDGSITATRQLKIDSEFEYTNGGTTINRQIELPFGLCVDNQFNIQTTLATTGNDVIDDLSYANMSVNRTTPSSYEKVDGSNVDVYNSFMVTINSPIYRLSESFIVDYKDAMIFITVKGNLPIV